jgi:chromatin modification-related protein VID21
VRRHPTRADGSEYREQHGVALRGLYRLLKRKRAGEYIDVSMGVDELEPPDDYDTWKTEHAIDAAGVKGVELPPVPAPSPPRGTIVFPDEAPVPAPQPPERELRRSSRPSSRAASRHGTPAAPRPAEPRATVALDDVLPRREVSLGAFGSEIEVDPWEPQDNYRPADEPGPSEAHKVLMPLENDYSARISKLPPVPHTRRRGSKSEGRPDTYKLSVMFGLNPLSGGLTRSPKVVLTADWRVAQAEMRHIRAMERIEAKKAAGRWSLRQPKKHRGPPVPKGHWDFLLDEMVSWRRDSLHGQTVKLTSGMDAGRLRRGEAMEARRCARVCIPGRRVAPELARRKG